MKGSDAQRRLIDGFLSGRIGPLASDRIVDAVAARLAEPLERPPLPERLRARFDAEWRSFVKQNVSARIPGHRNNPDFQKHRFQGMSIADLQARADRLSAAVGRFSGVKVRSVADHIFRVEA